MTDAAPLTRFQRMLLATDGTLTHILEAYADEPIEVEKLLQAFDTSTDDDAHLDLGYDEKVLRRRVLLRGRTSGRNLLYAEVVVVADRVDPVFLAGVVGTDKPIGLLLAESRMETFREILVAGRRAAGAVGPRFGLPPASDLVFRTYRVLAGGRPIMLITEQFPPHLFRALPA